ncbi:class I adenylate-forming enzyme family protein [Mycobacterium sp. 236(2023)]|uniref:class I adenylate-forming enzyme family protein n=1 Tax=Mycobacterium sp. 236(2023) TaxID=3038163 RepID=UPI002414DCF7|nr:class I adenylate-forming enzyme family protein [Mycobacterium sp. 236(2023)]MDG4668076.1 class I adenylate-forming enzyme family protein [Mycobacterium sp. 236(2023)]
MGPLGEWTPDGSLAKLLQWRVEEAPEHEFLYVEDDGPWSYGRIADEAVRLRDQLHVHGVSRGDLVVVRVGNDERFVAAAFGVWLLGGGVIAVHPSAPASDIVSVAASMRAEAVIADPRDSAAGAAGLPVVASARFSTGRRRGSREAGAFTAPADIAGTSIALVLLTSGSTGKPKGVALSHDGAWANLRSTVSAFRTDTRPSGLPESPKPPNLIANPLSHTAGVVRLLFALYVGRSVALLRKFDGVTAQRLIERHGIDNLTINPAMMRILLDALPPGERLGGVRYVSSGTAPLPAALREEFESRFDVPVLQAYGQTEAFGGIAIESVKDVLSGRRRPGSVGKPLPGVELRIVDSSGTDVADGGSVGELWVRTKSTTSGYLGSSDSSPVDVDGWLRTGDQGRLDSDGYLYITGRLKNIIICGGFNIVPEEIEAALIEEESVREAVVLGIADTRLGEVPVAVVESQVDSAALLARVADRLAPYKRPRQLFCVERLPRVPNGKVDRPAVAAMARELATPDGDQRRQLPGVSGTGQHVPAND